MPFGNLMPNIYYKQCALTAIIFSLMGFVIVVPCWEKPVKPEILKIPVKQILLNNSSVINTWRKVLVWNMIE